MNMNSPAIQLETPAGTFVVDSTKGVKALLRAFAWHLLDGAWHPVPDFDGDLTPSEVRKYFAHAALAAEATRGDDAPCVWVKSPYEGQVEVRWESRGTHGRWVSLSLSQGEWTLKWDSATGQESYFIGQSFMEPLLWACPELDMNKTRQRSNSSYK